MNRVTSGLVDDSGWMAFPGGELEGARPRALCPACREALKVQARGPLGARSRMGRSPGTKAALCFLCYRAELDRTRALQAAGAFNASSEARFQEALPFEPVNRPRLAMLKAERLNGHDSRGSLHSFTQRRHRAQIAARHALEQAIAAIRATGVHGPTHQEGSRAAMSVVRAAELQLPESWLPFVVSR